MPANKNALIRYKKIDNCLRNQLISYRGWNAVACGVTETDTRECDGTVDIDLSRVKYPK